MKKLLSLVLALSMVLGVICMAPPAVAAEKKLIAITYDDGPGPYTERLLDGLKKRGVKATFFMVGTGVASYGKTVERMYREGHQLANHTWNHPSLTSLSWSGVQSTVQRVNTLLDKVAGKGADYLVRPPYGSYNSSVASAAGAPLILWSVDTRDWQYRNATTVKNRMLQDAHDGAILLLHDIHSTSVDGSLAAIDTLKARGYEFVTVRELFRRRGASLVNGQTYTQCKPNGKDLGAITAPKISTVAESGKLRVTITAQMGTTIYYSTDGSDLNGQSKKYTGSFTVSTPCTIRACAAYNMNGSRSDIVEEKVTKPTAVTPTLRIENDMLVVTGTNAGANIYYTVTGEGQTGEQQVYTAPVPIAPGSTVSAYAESDSYLTSGTAKIVYSPLGNVFRDVFPGQWYFEYVDRAAAGGIMQGMGNNNFEPATQVTRGQIVTFLYRASAAEAVGDEAADSSFSDVEQGKYYTEAVAWANKNDIVTGYADNTFRPDRKITRQEMASIFSRYMKYKGTPEQSGTLESYTDAGDIADWAQADVAAVTALSLFKGDAKGEFRPTATSTRAEAATVLIRMQELLDAGDEPPAE